MAHHLRVKAKSGRLKGAYRTQLSNRRIRSLKTLALKTLASVGKSASSLNTGV